MGSSSATYRCPGEDLRPLLPAKLNASPRLWNRSVTSDHHMWLATSSSGIIPAPAICVRPYNIRATGNTVKRDVLSQIVVHSCAASCQIDLEREASGTDPRSFHGTDNPRTRFTSRIHTTKKECNIRISILISTSHTFVGRAEHSNVQHPQCYEFTMASNCQCPLK